MAGDVSVMMPIRTVGRSSKGHSQNRYDVGRAGTRKETVPKYDRYIQSSILADHKYRILPTLEPHSPQSGSIGQINWVLAMLAVLVAVDQIHELPPDNDSYLYYHRQSTGQSCPERRGPCTP